MGILEILLRESHTVMSNIPKTSLSKEKAYFPIEVVYKKKLYIYKTARAEEIANPEITAYGISPPPLPIGDDGW